MPDRLAVLVPSRGRPHNAERLRDSMAATCRGNTELILGIDTDDPALDGYLHLGLELQIEKDLRRQLVGWLNLMATDRLQAGYDYLGHLGDDNIARTDGWDVRIMEALEQNLFAFGNDLDPGREPGSLSIHIFMRTTVVERLGYMGPPQIQHMYVDPVWYAWGTRTSIVYLDDVVLEHMHYTVNSKAPHDETYGLSTSLIPDDCLRYNDYCATGLNADIEKLGGRPFLPDELSEFNRRLNIPKAWGQPA